MADFQKIAEFNRQTVLQTTVSPQLLSTEWRKAYGSLQISFKPNSGKSDTCGFLCFLNGLAGEGKVAGAFYWKPNSWGGWFGVGKSPRRCSSYSGNPFHKVQKASLSKPRSSGRSKWPLRVPLSLNLFPQHQRFTFQWWPLRRCSLSLPPFIHLGGKVGGEWKQTSLSLKL